MPRRRNKNIIKYRRPLHINVGLMLFLFLFVYLVVIIFTYFTKNRVEIYQVESGTVETKEVYTGLILRDEEVVTMNQSGYVNFYVKEGHRVAKDDTIYTIDGNGALSEMLQSTMEGMEGFSNEAVSSIKNTLYNFSIGYEDMSFSDIYETKSELDLEILNDLNVTVLDNISHLSRSSGFVIGTSEKSGIISYRIDGYESVTASELTDDLFDEDEYSVNIVQTDTLKEAGTALYKVIPDESFEIAIQIEEEYFHDLMRQYPEGDDDPVPQLTFTVKDTGQELTADYRLMAGKDSGYFLIFSVPKYGSGYIDKRFLEIEIVDSSESGLKIPKTSVTTESFFLIPREYATYGGDQNVYGFNRQAAGSDTVEFISPTFYALIDDYYYVNQRDFSAGDRILMPDSTETYVVSEVASLSGVFNINQGYAVFRRVEIVDETGDVYLIEKNTGYGLSVYDHIILDSSTSEEFDVIY